MGISNNDKIEQGDVQQLQGGVWNDKVEFGDVLQRQGRGGRDSNNDKLDGETTTRWGGGVGGDVQQRQCKGGGGFPTTKR